MAGAMVSALTGPMNSVLGKLSALLENEYAKHKNMDKDVLFLRNELSSISALLHKYAEMEDPDVQVKAWMKEVRELAYDIEDCIDAFLVRVEHMPDDPAAGIMGLLRKIIGKVKQLVSRHDIADEIQELKDRVVEVSERYKRYKLDDSTSMASVVTIDPRLPALYAEASGLVAIDGPRDKIIKWLIEEGKSSSVQQLKVLSIVGFGGLGKTTLAKQVYDTIKGQFDCTAFVTVSQTPNIKKILIDMLSQVEGKYKMKDDEGQLIDKLRECLKKKRYFIIIDDIWSIQGWETVKSILPENNVGSRVITTTRIIDVAQSCCSSLYSCIYNIQPLSDHDSRRLFFKRVFHSEYICPPHLKEVSNAILKKCGGVPLAILCISSLLASKPDTKDGWEQVRISIGSALEKSQTLEGMRKIILLSYYDLPHYLKTCLLYLSIFPEDYNIERNELVWRWIAEGFIAKERGKRLDEVGESYFNDLINRSMVQPIGIQYDGRAQHCRIHDLVLNIITSLSAEDNFVTVLNGDNCSSLLNHIRRLSLQSNHLEDASMQTITKSGCHVRSLTAFQSFKEIPNLLNFRALRVLDFSFDNLEENHNLIESIGNLFQLRYLTIRSIMREIPNQIGDFQYLEVLDIRYCYGVKFPETIGGLRKLVRLCVSFDVKLPDNIGNMQALEELSDINIPLNSIEFVEGLGRLTKLRKLTIYELFNDMGNDGGRYRETLICSLRKLGRFNLQSLTVNEFSGEEDFILDSLMASNCDLPQLRYLCISNDPLPRVPKWTGMLVNLIHLELVTVRMEERDLHILKHIPSLLFLQVTSEYAPSERVVLCSQGFQCLKEFRFCCGAMWLQFAPGAMPKLQRLGLQFYARETKRKYGGFDFGFEHLSGLQHVSVKRLAMDEAEAAIIDACTIHPNRPTLELYHDEGQ